MMYGETFLGPPHGITPAAVIANKNKTGPLRAVNKLKRKGDGPYRGFGYLSPFSVPKDLATNLLLQTQISLLVCITG